MVETLNDVCFGAVHKRTHFHDMNVSETHNGLCSRQRRDRQHVNIVMIDMLQVVAEELSGKKFDEQEAKEWSLNIADTIRERVTRQLNIPRYKVIVQVTVGQMLDQGVRVVSRCLWDTATDNYARCVCFATFELLVPGESLPWHTHA